MSSTTQTRTDPDFASYVRARQEHLLRTALLMCGDVHLAQDLVQEALVKLAKHWGRVSQGYPDAYVRRIIYHDNIARARKHRLELVTEQVPDVAGMSFVDGWAAQQDVRQALQQLPARQRATLVLRYFEELSEAEAARAMGVTVGTVKSQAHDALKRMRVLLGPAWGTAAGTPRRATGAAAPDQGRAPGAQHDELHSREGEAR